MKKSSHTVKNVTGSKSTSALQIGGIDPFQSLASLAEKNSTDLSLSLHVKEK